MDILKLRDRVERELEREKAREKAKIKQTLEPIAAQEFDILKWAINYLFCYENCFLFDDWKNKCFINYSLDISTPMAEVISSYLSPNSDYKIDIKFSKNYYLGFWKNLKEDEIHSSNFDISITDKNGNHRYYVEGVFERNSANLVLAVANAIERVSKDSTIQNKTRTSEPLLWLDDSDLQAIGKDPNQIDDKLFSHIVKRVKKHLRECFGELLEISYGEAFENIEKE